MNIGAMTQTSIRFFHRPRLQRDRVRQRVAEQQRDDRGDARVARASAGTAASTPPARRRSCRTPTSSRSPRRASRPGRTGWSRRAGTPAPRRTAAATARPGSSSRYGSSRRRFCPATGALTVAGASVGAPTCPRALTTHPVMARTHRRSRRSAQAVGGVLGRRVALPGRAFEQERVATAASTAVTSVPGAIGSPASALADEHRQLLPHGVRSRYCGAHPDVARSR